MTTSPPARLRVVVWNENVHERSRPEVARIYPEGLHRCIAAALTEAGLADVSTATLDEPEHGLAAERLDATDVLVWWGHAAHDRVNDAVVDRVQRRVLEGMGFVALHSAHESKPFRRLLGTPCTLRWREDGAAERVWVVQPGHPLAEGVGDGFWIDQEEMYGEPFAIPEPDELVFISWFAGGEVFRSGCCWRRGGGRIVYFRPGHETFATYRQPEVRRVVANAVRYAAPRTPPLVDRGSEWIAPAVEARRERG